MDDSWLSRSPFLKGLSLLGSPYTDWQSWIKRKSRLNLRNFKKFWDLKPQTTKSIWSGHKNWSCDTNLIKKLNFIFFLQNFPFCIVTRLWWFRNSLPVSHFRSWFLLVTILLCNCRKLNRKIEDLRNLCWKFLVLNFMTFCRGYLFLTVWLEHVFRIYGEKPY